MVKTLTICILIIIYLFLNKGCSDIRITGEKTDSTTQDLPNFTTPTTTSTTTSQITDTPENPTTFYNLCYKGDGFYTWFDCKSFYRCHNDQVSYFDCPIGTLFDIKYNICNWSYNVKCELLLDDSSSN